MKKMTIPLAILIVIFGLNACDEFPETLTVNETEQKEVTLTRSGWDAYENGAYITAISEFKDAVIENAYYADAYNGLGSSYARLDSLEQADRYFTIATVTQTEYNALTRDIYAGMSFVCLANEQYEKAVRAVERALIDDDNYELDSQYVFRHDFSITATDLLLVKAEAYFLLNVYRFCVLTLHQIDETLSISEDDPEELAAVIESLRETV
ncbi:MAG: hypothetical protein MAGBODY4_00644 [Candidatus Marinimicrobia bacterium]|nr:hypothetical protein [Candidatus Neomarinimicrobiota bacterium]